MKLAERHHPETKKIPDNDIYTHYHVQIDKALRAPGDRHPGKEYYGSDYFRYDLSEEELEFYDKLYLPSRLFGSLKGDVILQELFGSEFIDKNKIGVSEKLLIDFLRADNKLLIVKAPIGWGKTVLLKYFSFYLVPNSEELSKTVLPVYMSIDDNFNQLNRINTPHILVNQLYQDFLLPRLERLTDCYTELDNDKLWGYLKKNTDDYSDLNIKERDWALLYRSNPANKKYRERFLLERMKAKEKKDFYLCVARYIIDVEKRTPVLIFDNVDPLDIEVNRVILQEAVRICENYGLRVIVSMRDRTYDSLAAEPGGIFGTYPIKEPISLEKRNVREYLERRIDAAFKGAHLAKYTYIDMQGKRYTQSDADEVLRSMLRILITKEGSEFLDYITYHNLRQLNDLIKVYLATGYVEKHALNRAVIVERITQQEGFESPLWVLLSSILTANYETHFSSNCPNPHVLRMIANLYCNRNGDYNRHFIRIHLLNFFDREKKIATKRLDQTYQSIIEKSTPDVVDEMHRSLNHALSRLLECRLLISPEYCMVVNGDVIGITKELEITDTGEYYLKVLCGYFEYLAYMKDDVEFPTSINIKDCTEVSDREGRYQQIFLFLRFLFEMEKQFLLDMKPPQRKIFVENFSRSTDGNPFTIATAVEKMIKYGESHYLDKSNFNLLNDEMKKTIDNYIKR